jgi:phospholipid-binding lipoprotein MlaA
MMRVIDQLRQTICILGCAAALGGVSAPAFSAESVYDPLEPANRAIFTFNEYADMLLIKPLAQGYDFVVPDAGKRGVTNVLNNLSMPVVFVNSLLQGDPENSFEALWSFILNSTFGVAGVFDFTGTNTDLSVNSEDFGQTLGAWGAGSGPYLVLPLLGSSNMRDVLGRGVDYATDPITYAESDQLAIGKIALTTLDVRYRSLKLVDDIYDTSLDPYVTFRSAYDQRRNALIANTRSGDRNEE